MASAPRIPRRPTSKGERTGGTILYLDFPEGEDNHLRKLAGIRRYALTRDWEVQTITREELDHDEVKALCAGDGGRAKPVGYCGKV